jgi:mono/diheme cytochrome c family protein
MKSTVKILVVLTLSSFLASCGGNNETAEDDFYDPAKEAAKKEAAKEEAAANFMSNKGIGPVTSLTLDPEVNTTMAAKGEEIFTAKCSACHKSDKKFIGPNPTGVLDRRSPEWVMNMILNPEEMIAKDPIAKELLVEHNNAPMANQNLQEDEARAILEYFRTLK